MKGQLFLLCFFFYAAFLSCKKEDGAIRCPDDIIEWLKREPVRNPPAKLYKWIFKGETYYYVPSYCCDAMSTLYDADCKYICAPDGGLSGGGDGKCPFPYGDSAIVRELIWEDSRK